MIFWIKQRLFQSPVIYNEFYLLGGLRKSASGSSLTSRRFVTYFTEDFIQM